ncbi:hypothetical protein ACFL4C_00855 [Candidatus Omnitrophota bacterium]
MQNTLILILAFVILVVAMLAIPRWRLKRGIRQVIKIFRKHNALSIRNAREVYEMGFHGRGFLEVMVRGHDYQQYALRELLKAGVIQSTEDGRLYLSEDRLIESGLTKGISFPR